MKFIKPTLLAAGLFCIQNVIAQTPAHLKLANEYPEAGQKIAFTYDPTGTAIADKKDVTCVVYFLDNKTYPAADVTLWGGGKEYKGEVTIPKEAKAFFIKIAADGEVDNNADKGYLYTICKDKQPVAGAYASEAYAISSGMGTALGKIKMDIPAGLSLYKKELETHAESAKEYQSGYYFLMARDPQSKEELTKKIASLENSSDEKDLALAVNLLRNTKEPKAADSLSAVIKSKFPNGAAAKGELLSTFAKEKDIDKKIAIYNDILTKYPENADDKTTSLDYLRVQIAAAYLEKADIANFYKYESLVKEKAGLAGSLNNIAYEWAKKGEHMDEAAKASKLSLDIVEAGIKNPKPVMYAPPSQAKKNGQNTYDMYADTYAYILTKQNKLSEALKYQQGVVERSAEPDAELNEHYLVILNGLKKYAKAKEVGEKSVTAGQSNEAIKQELKKAYVKLKGSDAGFDPYLASLENVSKDKAKLEIAKTMINTPAPAFKLKDLEGKTVSLASLKGKTVVVDFWATWCGPCKASFPGMQIALNKYKDNPNVEFLFIDTWERGDDYLPGVKTFIADNKYTFHVLMDEKTDAGRQGKVVSTFGVDGIPTKFVIDKDGNIRFKYVGYSGSTDKVVNEVVTMVDMLNDQNIAKAAPASNGEGKSK